MGGGSKCLKILVLVTLIPVALRASSLLLGGHGGAPPATLLSRRSWHVTRRPPGLSVSSAASSVREAYRRTNRRKTEGTVRGGDVGWFEDDKSWRRRGPTRCTTCDGDPLLSS